MKPRAPPRPDPCPFSPARRCQRGSSVPSQRSGRRRLCGGQAPQARRTSRVSERRDLMVGNRPAAEPDVVLVGAGIMSATLAVFLKELEPALNIEMVETLDGAAEESSDAWNNAGTGHAALRELNYTPERSDGSIDISKALEVNVEFDLSR